MMRVRFSCGRRAWSLEESSSIPNIVKDVIGPSSSLGCRGKPKSEYNTRHVAKLLKQASDAGGPNVRKSSK